ncbi:MAG: DUF4157 domain-containing protein [Cyanobacteria bacterium P01_H01_bin.58]
MSEFSYDQSKGLLPIADSSPEHQLSSHPFVVQQKVDEATAAPSPDITRMQQLDAGVMQTLNIQTKLAIGAPGDKYEQEADNVAAQVVDRINSPQVQEKPIQREAMPEEDELKMKPLGQSIQREEMLEDDELMQGKSLMQRKPDGGGVASADLESSIAGARGQGQPLGDDVRGSMEQAFGADFSGVRVHNNSQSHGFNESIQARAFTTGQDIFFRQGEYQPANQSGQELLAHELTHVVQQNGSAVQAKKQS